MQSDQSQVPNEDHGLRVADVWISTAGNKVPIRRILDDFIRQGWNDERILNYMATEYTEYVVQVGLRSADLNWMRMRQDMELHGVPIQYRAAYRASLVKGVGRVMAPWDSSAPRYGTNNLELTNLSIAVLPTEIFQKQFVDYIRVLDLQHNELTRVPHEIGILTNLNTLRLGHNALEFMPPDIGKLRQLKFLSLNYNQLQIIPPEISRLRLECLFLENNRLELLPTSLALLTNLTDFRVQNNPLKFPPQHIVEKGRKQMFSYLLNVKESDKSGALSLNGMELKTFPPEAICPIVLARLCSGSTLTDLDLRGNQISKIPGTLRILSVDYSVARHLSALRSLSLEDNQFRRLPPVLARLSQLTSLNLERNMGLAHLPVELGRLTALTELRATLHPLATAVDGSARLITSKRQFASPPLEVLQQGCVPACYEAATGAITEPGSAGHIVWYLRMIDDARMTRRVLLARAGLKEYPPELHYAAAAAQAAARDNAESQHLRDRVERTFGEPASPLIDMELLSLEQNSIESMPESLGAFTALVGLAVDRNFLTTLPSSIGRLLKMTNLSASHNRLVKIPAAIGQCADLRRLALSHNRCSELPAALGKCAGLETLLLDSNRLTSLPASIAECSRLLAIDLRGNCLSNLPDAIGRLHMLRHLLLSANRLESVPRSLGHCTALGELRLDENFLQEVPSSIGLITALLILDLSDNPKLLFPPPEVLKQGAQAFRMFMCRFEAAPETESVDLSYLQLVQFPQKIFAITDIWCLDLSHNQMRSIPMGMGQMKSLEVLHLNHNRLRSLPNSVGMLRKLRSLHLNNNRITHLPHSLAELHLLAELCLHANKFRVLPVEIGALPNIKTFTISGNPLIEPPEDICSAEDGDKITFNYLKAMSDCMACGILNIQGMGLNAVPFAVVQIETLESIILDHNRIVSLPPECCLLTNLKNLSLAYNKVIRLPSSLGLLSSIQVLNLEHNDLEQFDEALLGLKNILNLNLSRNHIISIPLQIHLLSKIVILWLSYNEISNLPSSIANLTALTDLRFDHTNIRKVPMSFGSLTNLRCLLMDSELMVEPRPEITMEGLQITMHYIAAFERFYESRSADVTGYSLLDFPSEIMSFKHLITENILGHSLTVLNLSRNRISHLPEIFAHMSQLTVLDLSNNSFNRLPGAICWLTALKELAIQGNFHLRRLPIEMGNLALLEKLQATSYRFLAPPQEILAKSEPNNHQDCSHGVIEYLQLILRARTTGVLNLTRMGLRRFPPEIMSAIGVYWDYLEIRSTFITGRGMLNALDEIHLDHNNIQVLPACIGQLTRVKVFNLGSNLIQILPSSIANMRSIQTLTLSQNRLIHLHPIIALLGSLSKLQLQDNDLTTIPEQISSLHSLAELSVSKNKLNQLPNSLPKLTNLCNLLAAENNLNTDPSGWGLPGISHELGYMTNLTEINIDFNDAIEVPPRDLWKGSSSRIFEFLRNVYEAKSSRELRLHDMELRLIPEVVLLMQELKYLSLSRNTLRSISIKIRQLTSLTLLELDNNDLVILPEESTYLSNLKELRCSFNQLKGLPDTCHRWIRCDTIIATDNLIQRLPEGICEMPSLTVLDLERNKLRFLPEAFVICSNLTKLRFDSQDMVKASPAKDLPSGIRNCEIPAEIAIRGVDEIIRHFFKMHHAWSSCTLDLSGYGLRYLMNDVCLTTVLTSLNLAQNRIRILPEGMSFLVNLKNLNLDENFGLETFHHSLHHLTALKKISISAGLADNWHYPAIHLKYPPTVVARNPTIMRQYLKELYDCVGRKFTLYGEQKWETTLRLDYRFVPHEIELDPVTAADIESDAKRSFATFPPEIFDLGLTNLTWLQIPGGRITSEMMEECIPKMAKLKKLVLIDQEITYIPEVISVCSDMEVLCFTGNRITEIPHCIFKMISLTKLIMIENQLSVIPPEIGQLTNLTDLVLTFNKLTVLPKEIGDLCNLDYLVLDENKIRQIPDSIQKMTSLIELSFNDNSISRFPVSLGALTQLEILEFAKNPPILLPPKQVLQCEVKVVIDFMKRIWDCQQTQKLNMRKFQLIESSLSEIVKEIFYCCTDLNLSKNNLNQLPANLKQITGLNTLDVSENGLKTLNLMAEFEVADRPKPKKRDAVNFTLRQFCEELELPQLYDILVNEYQVKKMSQLRGLIDDENKLSGLGLGNLERMRLLDAVLRLDATHPNVEDNIEVLPDSDSDDDREVTDEDQMDNQKQATQEIVTKPEEEIDEEEALRLLEDQKASGPNLKINSETFASWAYSIKVNAYKMIVGLKAKMVERQRRKELMAFDQRVVQRANGYKAKVRRMEQNGVPKKKKKISIVELLKTEEERQAEREAKRAAKAKALADREKLLGGNIDRVVLGVSLGDGLVRRDIVSVAVFTGLVNLRARKNGLEYLPEDIGLLCNLTSLDVSKNDIRWLPPSFSNLVSLTKADLSNNLIFEIGPGISNCTSLTDLRLDHNKIYTLPESMSDLFLLTSLSLENNEFQLLPEWWKNFTQIRKLNFADNNVSKIGTEFIPMGENLVELRCPSNSLTQINFFFSRFVNLKILDVSNNPVEILPAVLGSCTSLEELYMNTCNLRKMHAEIAFCQSLQIFEFDGNESMEYPPPEVQAKLGAGVLKYFRQILDCPRTNMMLLDGFDLAEVDSAILAYRSCTWLDLSQNNLIKIPSEMRQMQKVELMNLSYNKLGCIPRILTLMPTINDLALDKNEIEQIEPSIVLLTRLTRLSLSSNRIARIHPSIFKLTSLNFLNLTDNKIHKIPGQIEQLTDLVSLGLGSNSLEEVPLEICSLTRLRQLVLFGNKLKEVPTSLCKLNQLEVLTLSQNNLVTFPSDLAKSLLALKELWLTHNQIRDIPHEISCLTNLEQLWLQDNKLSDIPQEIGDLTKLQVLTLTGNKIREIPRHIKSLKIVQAAVRENGEEYWQDKEVDGYFSDPETVDKKSASLNVTSDLSDALSQARTVQFNMETPQI